VKEVFISQRLNKWGRRFGFVRFFGVSNVGGLETELDQLYIGNRKLFVNVPKYRRHQPVLTRTERRNPRAPYLVSQKDSMKHHQKDMEISGKQRNEEMWVEKQGKRSYAEVVIGASEERWKGLSIKTEQHVLPWMEKSVVGKLRDVTYVNQLGEEVVKGGLNMV